MYRQEEPNPLDFLIFFDGDKWVYGQGNFEINDVFQSEVTNSKCPADKELKWQILTEDQWETLEGVEVFCSGFTEAEIRGIVSEVAHVIVTDKVEKISERIEHLIKLGKKFTNIYPT